MKRNISSDDKMLRVAIFLLIAGLYFSKVLYGNLGNYLFLSAFLILLTTFINFCPLYWLIGVSTHKDIKRSH